MCLMGNSTLLNFSIGHPYKLRYLSKLLKDAKVSTVDELKGKPIEVTFDGNLLKNWRILTEVI